jgi:hypothetical protein
LRLLSTPEGVGFSDIAQGLQQLTAAKSTKSCRSLGTLGDCVVSILLQLAASLAEITAILNPFANKQKLPIQQTAWYVKKLPTFSDALSIVQQTLASEIYFRTSPIHCEIQKILPPRSKHRSLTANWAFL